MGKIKIITETSEGNFILGKVYPTQYTHNRNFVWVEDEDGDIEPVYVYEFEWVD